MIGLEMDDYALLDFGDGRKLERFGPYIVDRPAPQASGKSRQANWQPDWVYSGERITDGAWQAQRQGLEEDWQIEIAGQLMHCRLGKGGQVGIYPEHAACWQWITQQLAGVDKAKVLNLFAGTGGATQAAVLAGAQVTHVDAQASQLALAKRNVGDQGARFIKDDVLTYVARMIRKGQTYQMLIMDPPSFGRAAKGKDWDIRRDFLRLVESIPQVLAEDYRGIWVSWHSPDIPPELIAAQCHVPQAGQPRQLDLGTQTADGRVLTAGVALCWQKEL